MTILPLAKVSFIMSVVALVWVFIAIALILIVLIQKGRGGGLSGAFGGAGASSLFGTKTGDWLTWVTIGLVSLFLILGVVMAKYYRPLSSEDLAAPVPEVTVPADIPADQPDAEPIPDADIPAADTPPAEIPQE